MVMKAEEKQQIFSSERLKAGTLIYSLKLHLSYKCSVHPANNAALQLFLDAEGENTKDVLPYL